MNIRFMDLKCLVIHLLLVSFMLPLHAHADNGDDGSVVGNSYNTYLYATYADDSSVEFSFEENLSLLIDIYDGFGVYLPVANLFFATYWAPDYSNKKDLSLVLSGAVISDFIAGSGIAFRDYQFHGLFLFFGYSE